MRWPGEQRRRLKTRWRFLFFAGVKIVNAIVFESTGDNHNYAVTHLSSCFGLAHNCSPIAAEPEYLSDLIILDLNIPKVSGLEVLERHKPTAPIVVFTSSSNPAERERAKELGVREFVQKPIDFGEFSRVVMRMVKDWVRRDASGVAAE